MQQVALVQSGCQQWIRQPAAIHGEQFAFSSSLAVFLHASDDYRLLKLLSQQTRHINALCWSPHDCNLIACSNAEKAIRVYSLTTDAAVYSSTFPYQETVSSLRWAAHDTDALLAASSNSVACWHYNRTAEWQLLHSFRAAISCMQQSATEPRLLAVGCTDASLHIFDVTIMKVICTIKLDESAVPCDVQFDPFSKAYLLLLCSNGSIALYEVDGDNPPLLRPVLSLAKQPAAHRSAAFVPNAPGSFAVISNKSGILQLWNVSQQQPMRSLKVGSGPAQSITFFPGSSKALITLQDGTVMVYDVDAQVERWCSQPGHTETIFDCCFAPITNSHLLATCSFDGTVRVWNAATNCFVKTLETQAHGQQPPGVMKGVPDNALYSVCWSPDGNLLAASSAGGAVYLFDYAKGLVLKKWQLHSKPCLKVTWHPFKPNVLASSGLDGRVVVFKTDGTKLKVLQHSSASSCCAWAKEGYLLATTSEAGLVYIWDLNKDHDGCHMHSLLGHAKRSFAVLWSPLVPHLLLSGSDDATARVWDSQTGTCLALLARHQAEVRALCWHPELPWLVFTGSWDATIHCWDWRQQTSVYVCTQHHSDVYGLSIHSSSPWLLASASRDATLRLWDVRGLAAGILTRCFLEGIVQSSKLGASWSRGSEPWAMWGPASQQLANWLQNQLVDQDSTAGTTCILQRMSLPGRIEFCARLCNIFMPPGSGSTELWQLAMVTAAHMPGGTVTCTGAGSTSPTVPIPETTCTGTLGVSSSARPSHACGIVKSLSSGSTQSGRDRYVSQLARSSSIRCSFDGCSSSCTGPGCLCHLGRMRAGLLSSANQLEVCVRSRGVGRVVMGTTKKEQLLQEAAVLHLQAGDAERCCELLVEAGQWDRALALAPIVSGTYWKGLMQRRTDSLAQEQAAPQVMLPYLLAAGQHNTAVELLLKHRDHAQAAGIAAVAACGGYAKYDVVDSKSSSHSLMLERGQPQALSPVHSLTHQCKQQLHIDKEAIMMQQPHSSLHVSPSSLSKHNSLPPLRSMCSLQHNSNSEVMGQPRPAAALPALGGAAAAADHHGVHGSAATHPAGVLSADNSAVPARRVPSPCAAGDVAAPGITAVSNLPGYDAAAATATSHVSLPVAAAPPHSKTLPARSSLDRLQPQLSYKHAGGVFAASEAAASAYQQLKGVCKAQVALHRSHGEPIKAACAALTVHDVPAAVDALHFGHEPELAAMLCCTLGQLASIPDCLHDRVFQALAVKCEGAGDWWAAALALGQLHSGAAAQQQLLVVREEQCCNMNSNSTIPGQHELHTVENSSSTQHQPKLRQQLHLHSTTESLEMSRKASDAIQSVRLLLLAQEHGQAAAKAVCHIQPLVVGLREQVLSHLVNVHSQHVAVTTQMGDLEGAAPRPHLLTTASVLQLADWHTILESLSAAAVAPPCWQEVFSYLLLTGALRAYSFAYQQVGSFLLSRLRHWIVEHNVLFPLKHAVLLLLEAVVVGQSSPEAYSSLLHAVLACTDADADVRTAADAALQALATSTSKQACVAGTVNSSIMNCSYSDNLNSEARSYSGSGVVIASHSSLPHRPAPVLLRRSAVSGNLLPCGPWVYADDGCSLLSANEAVMLSHVMRLGPFGTGRMTLWH